MKKPILIVLSLAFMPFAAYAEDNTSSTYPRDDSSKVTSPGTRAPSDMGATSDLKGAAPDNLPSAGTAESTRAGVPDNTRIVAPDNTKINARDKGNQTLTSGNQSNSKRDIKLTSTIRRSIMKSGLTTLAKNVKIITVNGNVTLRGPVNTEAEKEKIGSLANSVQGVNQLDNQLEVKTISNLTTKE